MVNNKPKQLVYLISTELKALEEISKMCGEKKSKKDDKTVSTPLITITDLQKLKLFEVIIRRVRLAPFKTKLTPNFKMNWGKSYPTVSINDVPSREIGEVKTFDVRKFVDEKVKKNKDNLLDFASGPTLPFFGGMPSSNPFMEPGPMHEPKDSLFDNNKSFDVDDIVKKIDEKIAQLEKEEQEEKMKEANVLPEKQPEINLNTIVNSPKVQEKNVENLNEIINNSQKNSDHKVDDNEKKVLIDDDDEFFDDFFE